jgi:hypothetical protein
VHRNKNRAGEAMRIAKASLMTSWIRLSALAILVFAILAYLDYRLKALSGVCTADLAGFDSKLQFQAAFAVWRPLDLATRAGFNLGFDYLLMPLYAAAFFYAGIIAAEGLTPRRGTARRIIMALIWVPVIGAIADACENAVQLAMLFHGISDTLVGLSATASRIKDVALLVGLLLFVGAAMARFQMRRSRPDRVGFGD